MTLSHTSNAPPPGLAAEFIRFLVGPEGQDVMAQSEHPMILPPVVDNKAALPEAPETAAALKRGTDCREGGHFAVA